MEIMLALLFTTIGTLIHYLVTDDEDVDNMVGWFCCCAFTNSFGFIIYDLII